MKVVLNHPHIYCCIEPNLIFVYRMKTENYITPADLVDGAEWKVFELSPNESFETFNHQKSQPVEGRGFFLNQEDLGEMSKEINRHIQKSRQTGGVNGPRRAVHIVTSESTAGSLRAGIDQPKTVIGFPDSFSIGPLWKLTERIGQDLRRAWLFDHINTEQEDVEYEIKFSNALREIEDIAPHTRVYLWFGDNAEEQTGLRFYLYLLKDKSNPIFLMNATEEETAPFHTGWLDFKILRKSLENSQEMEPLTEEEHRAYAEEWIRLSETGGMLRVWKNSQIQAVPEDYYDPLIIETLEKLHNGQATKDYILTAQVIGEIVSSMEEFIDYFYLEYRIRHLVYNRMIDFKGIPKSMRHYRVKLPS